MAINITGLENASTFVGVVQELDTLTHGLLILFILFSVYIIMLTVMSSYTLKISSMVAGFITSGVALLLYAGGFIGTQIVAVPIVLLVISLLIFWFTKDD